MPLEDISTELTDIEVRQQELERQSAQLEQMVREKTEEGNVVYINPNYLCHV